MFTNIIISTRFLLLWGQLELQRQSESDCEWRGVSEVGQSEPSLPQLQQGQVLH